VILDGKIPAGPVSEKWDKRRQEMKLVNPANKRKYKIIVVGTGLAGASAAASLGELGYNIEAFCYQDSAAFSASSMTPSREAISAPGRPMSTASPRSATTSSTSVPPRVFPLPATMRGISTTAPSEAPRSPEPSTPEARRGSSSCWGPIRPSPAR
jgi:hypothetical protein